MVLTLLINDAQSVHLPLSAHKPEMSRTVIPVPEKHTGGERRWIPRGCFTWVLTEKGWFIPGFSLPDHRSNINIPDQQ